MGCQNGKCELDGNPSSGSSGYVWQCVSCGFTLPINDQTYPLFNPLNGKCNCPKCGWDLVATPKPKKVKK